MRAGTGAASRRQTGSRSPLPALLIAGVLIVAKIGDPVGCVNLVADFRARNVPGLRQRSGARSSSTIRGSARVLLDAVHRAAERAGTGVGRINPDRHAARAYSCSEQSSRRTP